MVEQYEVRDGETVGDYNLRVGLKLERQRILDKMIDREDMSDWEYWFLGRTTK